LYKLRQTDTVQQFNYEYLMAITLVRDLTEDEKVDMYTYGIKPHPKYQRLMPTCTTPPHAMQVASKSEMVFTCTHREMPNVGYNRGSYNTYNDYHRHQAHTGSKIPQCRRRSITI
jgi:hypothetical protein